MELGLASVYSFTETQDWFWIIQELGSSAVRSWWSLSHAQTMTRWKSGLSCSCNTFSSEVFQKNVVQCPLWTHSSGSLAAKCPIDLQVPPSLRTIVFPKSKLHFTSRGLFEEWKFIRHHFGQMFYRTFSVADLRVICEVNRDKIPVTAL